MRILGKGKTAEAIKEIYQDAKLFDDNDKEGYELNSNELTVVSPGIPPCNDLVQKSKNLVSDYDLFLNDKHFSIWISGTNGKTTTTEMIYHLLKELGFEYGGNIGVPLAKIYTHQKLILETSSFTLHYTKHAKPNIYVLLPISEDHISWHGSFEEYEKSKLTPLYRMQENDIAIIPWKYSSLKLKCRVYTYKETQDLAEQFQIDVKKLKFKEPFTMDSILALSVAKLYTQNEKIEYEKINHFQADPHKIEEFVDSKGRVWVDDSKATNIDATIQALKSYSQQKIHLIVGGDDKGADLKVLFNALLSYDVTLYCIGKNTEKLIELSKEFHIPFEKCHYLEVAVGKISLVHNTKDVAILSPAAASLDQFESYKHRGETFKKAILEKN